MTIFTITMRPKSPIRSNITCIKNEKSNPYEPLSHCVVLTFPSHSEDAPLCTAVNYRFLMNLISSDELKNESEWGSWEWTPDSQSAKFSRFHKIHEKQRFGSRTIYVLLDILNMFILNFQEMLVQKTQTQPKESAAFRDTVQMSKHVKVCANTIWIVMRNCCGIPQQNVALLLVPKWDAPRSNGHTAARCSTKTCWEQMTKSKDWNRDVFYRSISKPCLNLEWNANSCMQKPSIFLWVLEGLWCSLKTLRPNVGGSQIRTGKKNKLNDDCFCQCLSSLNMCGYEYVYPGFWRSNRVRIKGRRWGVSLCCCQFHQGQYRIQCEYAQALFHGVAKEIRDVGVRVSSHKPQCLSDIQTRSNWPIESSFADNSSLQHAYLNLPSHVSEHVWVAYFLWPILKVFSSTQNSGGGPWLTTSPFECRASSSLFGLGFRNCSGTSSPAPFHQWTW